jgi:hypothetical protein
MRILLVIGALALAFPAIGCDEGGQGGLTQEEMNDAAAIKKSIEKLGAVPSPKSAMPSPNAKK